MIEASQFLPRLGGMACLAAQRRTVFARLLHLVRELPVMRIFMTTGASQVVPVVLRHGLGFECFRWFVAFGAGNRNVASSEGESSIFVAGKGKG